MKPDDLTGRSRLVSNVLFSWGAQLVFIVAGFVMPRMIDHKLGQEVLGVWDFSWSVVTYFRLIEMGITSSVNRYVAKHWGVHDIAGVNRVVSAATCALLAAALVIVLITVTVFAFLPHWFGAQLKEHLPVAQWSVLFLGVMMAIGTATGAFNGVLTGCHRWELQSMRQAFWHFTTVVGMLIALWLGAGLATLAAITCICQTLGQLTVVTLAFRVCKGLRLRPSLVAWQTIKDMYVYSAKALLPSVSSMILNQTASLLILGQVGPAALAIFTRPRSLLTQMDSLQRKMSMVLTPTASSLQSCGDMKEIRNLLTKAVRYSLFLVLPMVLVLVIFGGYVMQFWMGPGYANHLVPAILAFGFIGSAVQTPMLCMLEGLNAHGWAGVVQFIAAACSVVLSVAVLRSFQSGLVGMAIAVTVPLLVVNLIFLPRQVCRRLDMNYLQFIRQAFAPPFICLIPFALCLVAVRLLRVTQPGLALFLLLAGSIALVVLYWRSVLPLRIKEWVRLAPERLVRAAFTRSSKAA
jgi:O-antigen/teichoic acid export membrane protein